jgi:predicted RNase H-like nuclease (RuvC/YqgF family)
LIKSSFSCCYPDSFSENRGDEPFPQATKSQILLMVQALDQLVPSVASLEEKITQLKKEFFIQLQNENLILQNQINQLQNENQKFQKMIQNLQNDLNIQNQEILKLQNEIISHNQRTNQLTDRFYQQNSTNILQQKIRKQDLRISKLKESFNWFSNVLLKYFDFFYGSNLTNKKRSSSILILLIILNT